MDMMSYLMGKNSGGGGKGATIEVVTELPETGEANVIYLVPKETEDENNVFDEYIWINDDWELIGTTDIDLSNYVTKSELDASNNTFFYHQSSNNLNSGTPIRDNDTNVMAYLTKCLRVSSNPGTDVMQKLFVFSDYYGRKLYMYIGNLAPGGTSSTSSLLLSTVSGEPSAIVYKTTYYYQANGKTVTSFTLRNDVANAVVLSSKKYVDDSIANKQDVLTAGSNITIENNVISASGGSSGDAKVYVYKITSGRGIHTISSISATETNDLQRMGEIITNGYAHGLTGLYFGTTGYNFINFMSLSTNLSEKPTTIYFSGTIFASPNDSGAGFRYIEAYIEVKGTWSDDIFTCSQVKYVKNNTTSNGYVTTWGNTNAITPTSDYNPATKKYVDDKLTTYSGYDATKTQILKNINGTLTWVDE